tara:strand:+ start:205 stop:639 length:435 start_codon:yes stop_codon:yes gene_type:complete
MMRFGYKNLFFFSLGASVLIFQQFNKVSANPITVNVNGTSYSVGTNQFSNYSSDISIIKDSLWWGNSSLAQDFATTVSGDNGLTLVANSNSTIAGPIFAFSEPETQKLLFAYTINGTVSSYFLTNTYNSFGVPMLGAVYTIMHT